MHSSSLTAAWASPVLPCGRDGQWLPDGSARLCRSSVVYNGSVAEVAVLVDTFQAIGSTLTLLALCCSVCAVAYVLLREPAEQVALRCTVLLYKGAGNLFSSAIQPKQRPLHESCSISDSSELAQRAEAWASGAAHHGVRHLAVIMDGNRRFGKASQQASAGPAAMWEKSPACRRADALMAGSNTPLSGHYAGGEKLMEFILWCIQWRIEMLTVYAFSTENWSRPPEEISLLMLLFEHFFERIRAMSKQHGIFIRFVSSDPHLLSPRIQRLMAAVEEEARRVPHRRIVVNVCVSYGGRSEIIRACCAAAAAAGATRSFKSGEQCSRKGSQRHAGASAPAISGMLKTEVTEADVTRHMLRSVTQSDHEAEDAEILSGGLGEPQALLRTSGEQRISNFLLWQSAYSELFFLKKTWPELTSADLAAVLGEFESRQRRFGK